MMNSMKTYALVAWAAIFLCGCFTVPNYKMRAEQDPARVPARKFKYGKYCGAGHPTFASEPGSAQRTRDLMSIWPPVDDIDLMCYAHDLCYQVAGSQNLVCDQAVAAVAAAGARAFDRPSGCRNLAKLIATGLGAKVTGSEKNRSGAFIITMANAVWSLPRALIYYGDNHEEMEKYGYPEKEGTCFKYGAGHLHAFQIISDFEADYREYAKGFETFTFGPAGSKAISLPVPLDGWTAVFPVFEAQKYLNYYGYNAGTANGTPDGQLSRAVERFRGKNRVSASDTATILQALKKQYVSRPYEERMDVVRLSPDEQIELFGYEK